MKFIIDAQLPPSLAGVLTAAGYESVALRDLGLREAEDESIWNYAETHQLIILTKDEDFAERQRRFSSAPAVVWLRIGNCYNRALIEWLLPLFPDIMERLEQGDLLVEVS